MTICYDCGEEITFRYIDGQRTPIHLNGGCVGRVKKGFSDYQTVIKEFTCESYVNPNARCSICGKSVFFYQSPNGGRVFFDELGPPWPKHPCGNMVYFLQNIKLVQTKNMFQWQVDDWKPFILLRVESLEYSLRLCGYLGDEYLILCITEATEDIGGYPILVKTTDEEQGSYCIATFRFESKEGKIIPVQLVAELPVRPTHQRQLSNRNVNVKKRKDE